MPMILVSVGYVAGPSFLAVLGFQTSLRMVRGWAAAVARCLPALDELSSNR
jgi:hypothetical protein